MCVVHVTRYTNTYKRICNKCGGDIFSMRSGSDGWVIVRQSTALFIRLRYKCNWAATDTYNQWTKNPLKIYHWFYSRCLFMTEKHVIGWYFRAASVNDICIIKQIIKSWYVQGDLNFVSIFCWIYYFSVHNGINIVIMYHMSYKHESYERIRDLIENGDQNKKSRYIQVFYSSYWLCQRAKNKMILWISNEVLMCALWKC